MIYPQAGSPAEVAFGYDEAGRRTDSWLQTNADHSVWGGHTHTSYDDSGRVVAVSSQRGPAISPTTVVELTYCYAAGSTPAGGCTSSAGTDRSAIQWETERVSGQSTVYSYDNSARLTKAVITGGTNPRSYSYGYDAAGNRTSSQVTGTSPSSQSLSFNPANQISSSGYAYDGAGNQTAAPGRTASYNTAGQRTSSTVGGVTTSYSYAGPDQNELLSQATPGGDSYTYSYGRADQNGLPEIEETTRTTASGTTYQAYIEHDNTGLPVLLQTSTGSVCLYTYDGRNNPISLTTNFATTAYLYTFDPYGNPTVTHNSGGTGYPQNPYLFAGGLQDRATGLIKYGARWYDPSTGTWTQQDTRKRPPRPHQRQPLRIRRRQPHQPHRPHWPGRVQCLCSNYLRSVQCSRPAHDTDAIRSSTVFHWCRCRLHELFRWV